MKTTRKNFIKLTGMTGLGIAAGSMFPGYAVPLVSKLSQPISAMDNIQFAGNENLMGAYGEWGAKLLDSKLPSLSFRRKEFASVEAWKKAGRKRLAERLAVPDSGAMPTVTLKKQYNYDGLHIEELSWQLPYGPATDAILLKPENAKGKLPAILAFHDHGGNKYFGTRKITKTSDEQHPLIVEHQQHYYEGMAWANEIAKQGYVVLVSDAFPFASRRILLEDVPVPMREGLNDNDPEKSENIGAYNKWAGEYEHVLSKSLFCAGTTWPGVFYGEDKKALDVLCARPDVDVRNIGCAGLSGGGMRTVFMAGQDDRIKCCVCVGFMTTWKDFMLYKTYTHTWMIYVPLLPNELDFPEILALRAPLPTMVLNDSEDQLYTPDGMKSADSIMREIFKKAGAENKYKCNFYPGEHKFDRQMQKDAFEWFDKWLRS